MMAWRKPSPEEVHALVEDVAHLTHRFRVAFETRYAAIVETQGEAAAQAWYQRAQAVGNAARNKSARVKAILSAGSLGCFVLTLLAIMAFAWFRQSQ